MKDDLSKGTAIPDKPPQLLEGPDWRTMSDGDMLDHALDVAGQTYTQLLENDADPRRPEGCITLSIVEVPCPNPQNIAQQLRYIGHLMERFIEYDVMVRDIEPRPMGEIGSPALRLVVCTAESYAQAERETTQASNH